MAEGKGRVCVTGGTGFIASIIIRNLLQEGYYVNTTVRSGPANSKKDVSFLTNLPGASERLQIFNADLSNPESFGESIVGCVGVIHTASPVDFQVNEPPETVIKRSVDGAIGILKACLDSKTVKRVVYTSSGSAVIHNRSGAQEMDESYWSDVDFLNETKQFSWSYAISKTLAEKAVLEFGEKNGLEVVSLIPPFVLGPFICAKLPISVHTSLSLLFNDSDNFGALLRFPIAHVDDLARAHIFLFEHPNPKGRYNCSPSSVTLQEIAEFIRSKHPEYKLPSPESIKEIKGENIPHMNSKKLIDAGFKFKYGTEETFEEAIQCCKEKGYLK
ncbi:vestitone reductase-like [Arachis stenosperma]|uniref:vestitone reductase-like n=1 Tax=Arachis stenosperma TaxID=217475 RepID=UPI0025AB7334|nr:vestitone reductase-like [Arachis stenosperma]